MTVGLFDDICPPRINFAAFNNAVSKKAYQVSPQDGHGISQIYIDQMWKWVGKEWDLKVLP